MRSVLNIFFNHLLIQHVIKTIDIDQEFFEVFEEPFDWYEEPIVIEPERKITTWLCW